MKYRALFYQKNNEKIFKTTLLLFLLLSFEENTA